MISAAKEEGGYPDSDDEEGDLTDWMPRQLV
jgi:hypothetical protein